MVAYLFIIPEHLFESNNMPAVLFHRISEFCFVMINGLCPVFRIFVAVNPAAVVFGFDHKNAVHRNHHMIDLAASPICLNYEVMKNDVSFSFQFVQPPCNPRLTLSALNFRCILPVNKNSNFV